MSFEFGMRLFLAAYFTFVAAFYSLRLGLARPGVRLVHHGRRFGLHWWGHFAFRVFRLLIWGICLLRVFYTGVDSLLVPIAGMQSVPLQLAGAMMLCAGFVIAVAGHSTLGEDWRSGIDPDGPSRLVTDRLYAMSRNPMYLGVMLAQAGFFLALPSVFTLVCLVVGVIAILNQVSLEERHLRRKFPQQYADYSARVMRWLPRPRR